MTTRKMERNVHLLALLGATFRGADFVVSELLPGAIGRGFEETLQWTGMHQEIGLTSPPISPNPTPG
jgi:hypothetical protein